MVLDGPGLVTAVQAAELVGVKPATVRSWKRRGLLVEFEPGLFHTDAVFACERKCRRTPGYRGLRKNLGRTA